MIHLQKNMFRFLTIIAKNNNTQAQKQLKKIVFFFLMFSYFWRNVLKVFKKHKLCVNKHQYIDIPGTYFESGANLSRVIIYKQTEFIICYNRFDRSETILRVCLPGELWMLFWGDGGSRSGPRNSPSCSSAMSVLTLRDKEAGFMSGRLTSPDSSRLRATSARQMSCTKEKRI